MNRLPDKQNKKSIIKKEYLLVIFLAVIAIVIFLSNSNLDFSYLNKETKEISDYVSTLESDLESVLKEVKGVGSVKVMITVEGSECEVVLKEVETTVENGVKTTKESIVLIGGKPYVTHVENPKIKGVVIVCSGADDLQVKMSITEIINTTLSVNSECVRIIKMK